MSFEKDVIFCTTCNSILIFLQYSLQVKIETTFAYYNKNGKSDKFSINDSNSLDNNKSSVNYSKSYGNDNFLSDYFDNNNIRMVNVNDTKILYILSNNSFPDFSTIIKCNRVIYIADVVYKAGFILLTDVFLTQLYNFPSLKVDGLHIV